MLSTINEYSSPPHKAAAFISGFDCAIATERSVALCTSELHFPDACSGKDIYLRGDQQGPFGASDDTEEYGRGRGWIVNDQGLPRDEH
jgi:hypothetical protein